MSHLKAKMRQIRLQ